MKVEVSEGTERKPTLLPEFASEALTTITTVFRTTRKVAEGIERTVDGMDEVATLMLKKQKARLLEDLAPA
jgi:hypothetical protein